ncbi:MAG: omcB 1 [Planctomycetaceae bacterium]|nr:omcB 1 [Planctomycetaceae bacterium]
METWGELFWDAWIRLRLWCRSLYRTYWPPHIKAWQVCTVTGIVSVLLTLVALNYQPAAAKSLGKDQAVAEAGKPVNPKVAAATAKLAAAKDPFADESLTATTPPLQDPVEDKTLASVDDLSPDGVAVTEHPDPGFEAIGARKFRKNQPAGEEIAAADGTAPQLSTDLTPPAKEEMVPEAAPESALTLPPDVPETTPAADLFEEPAVTGAPGTAPPLNQPVTEPVDEPVGEPAETIAAAKGLPEPVKHEPLVTRIRSKSHYSRLGHHEDSEEDRHSVRDIRPTRVGVVMIPGRDAGQPASKDATPEPKAPAAQIPVAETDATPVVPAAENPADNLTLPPAVAAPVEAVPVETVPREQPAFEPTPAEPIVEGPPPPVLFAPEAPVPATEPTLAEKPVTKPKEYHGPVLSTDGLDHEAHQEEDNFSNQKRKTPLLSDPPPAPPTPPVAPPIVERRKPVEPATDGLDHEVHQEEDIFSNTKRKTPLLSDPPPARPTPPVAPPVVERRKPVEPATEPRTSRRAPPREIHDDSEARPATDIVVPNSRVVPMAVPDATRQRGPERITVPDRMPPVPPMERTEPRGRQESSFAVPPTTQSVRPETAPRLVMAITGPKQAPVGTQVVWHFKIQNVGSAPATGIMVSDVLPPGLQHRLSPDLEYAIDRLEPGETRETNLTVQCVAPGTITNRAVLRADGDLSTEAEIQIEVAGSSPGNSVPAGKSPVTVAHHGPERWLVDSTGQFLVTVTNTSNERLRNVTISQSYPKGTNLVHATLGNKVDQNNRTVTWTIPDFAPGASYILETELHCIAGGPGTSSVRVKVGETLVAEDRWTAVSFIADGRP